jgi:hypothetical protein
MGNDYLGDGWFDCSAYLGQRLTVSKPQYMQLKMSQSINSYKKESIKQPYLNDFVTTCEKRAKQ